MATTPTPVVTQFLQPYESDILRNLIAQRNQANENMRNYLLQILGSRGLDPNKFGVSPDLRSFQEIVATPVPTPQAEAPATPTEATPTAAGA